MAKRKGQVVTSTLVTPDTTCTFPVVDVNDIGGGRLIVDTVAERNAIPPKFRKEGMVVRVQGSVKKDYELLAGFSNTAATLVDANWKEYTTAIPEGVLTEHQKAEQITYQDSVTSGYATLVEKLAAMDTAIGNALTDHQKVEDILYDDPGTYGYTTLLQKLAAMDAAITTAGAAQTIEDISWDNTPAAPSDTHGHASTLAGELENLYTKMNDPSLIMIENADFSFTNLQATIDALKAKVPTIEEIKSSDGVTTLSSLLTNDSDAITTIKYDSSTTLKAKIDAIASSAAGVPNIGDITWATTPSTPAGMTRDANLGTELNNIFGIIKDQNDPTKISVPTSASDATVITLQQKLNNIDSAITAAAGGDVLMDKVKWATTPSSSTGELARNQTLNLELNTLFGAVNTINTTIADMNKDDKIMVMTSSSSSAPDQTLRAKLAALDTALTNNDTVEHITWATTPTSVTGGLARSASLSAELETLFTGIKNINDVLNDPDEILVLANPGTVGDTTTTPLSTKLADLEATAAAPTVETINWATTPTLPAGVTRSAALSTEIDNLFAKVYSIEVPQYLLYNTSAPEAGALTSQEFLTTYSSKICEVAVYTNADATLTNVSGQSYAIKVVLEKCESSASTYTALNSTEVTLAASETGLMKRVDFTGGTPEVLGDNCRLRLNITAYNTANVVDVLNVRVKLLQNVV